MGLGTFAPPPYFFAKSNTIEAFKLAEFLKIYNYLIRVGLAPPTPPFPSLHLIPTLMPLSHHALSRCIV